MTKLFFYHSFKQLQDCYMKFKEQKNTKVHRYVQCIIKSGNLIGFHSKLLFKQCNVLLHYTYSNNYC